MPPSPPLPPPSGGAGGDMTTTSSSGSSSSKKKRASLCLDLSCVSPPNPLGVPDGSIRFKRRIGTGSEGEVYMGERVNGGERVAVKVVTHEAQDRLRSLQAMVSRLSVTLVSRPCPFPPSCSALMNRLSLSLSILSIYLIVATTPPPQHRYPPSGPV